jgi:hypothetical protein
MNHGGAAAGAMQQDQGSPKRTTVLLHPAWHTFIRYCAELRHGDIERLRIQDGLPIMAEETRKKVRFVE